MTRPRVLVLASDALFPHFFSETEQKRLADVADWTRSSAREDTPELRAEIANVDVLLTTWHSPFITPEMLPPGSRVKLIAHCGGEVKSRVAEPIFDYVTITNAADPMASGVAEMALALVLTLVRRIPEYSAEMRSGITRTNEQVSEGETLRGRKVGIVGFGRIGRAFAELIKPFKVELLVSDPYAQHEAAGERGALLVELDRLVRTCSVVVLAAALTPETQNLFDQRRLALLPDGACLVNVARGGLVHMAALLSELRTGRLRAAVDVTDPLEPLPVDHELRKLPNVILTPHIAAGGIEVRRAMGALAVDEVVRFANGQAPRNRVTRAMLARMT